MIIKASNVTVEGHNLFVEDYIVFPYKINYSKILNDKANVSEFLHRYSFIAEEIFWNFANQDIIKVPKDKIVTNAILSLGETTKSNISNQSTKSAAEKRVNSFLKQFRHLYLPHVMLLTNRVIQLNTLIDMGAPITIREAEERLCVKEAILMLGIIQTCAPQVSIAECFYQPQS